MKPLLQIGSLALAALDDNARYPSLSSIFSNLGERMGIAL